MSQEEVSILFNSLNLDGNDHLSRVERYANGHLFQLSPKSNELKSILFKIACSLDNEIQNDEQIYSKFSERVNNIVELANKRKCILYIDAE